MFGGGSGPPEAPLWDHLDRCGIDFRASAGALAARYGTHPLGWANDIDICLLEDADAFLRDQADPIAFELPAAIDLAAPPPLFRCAVRATGDFRLNYARAIAALVKLFGQGQETPTDLKVARTWTFGQASVECFVIPPDRLEGSPPSKRNLMFPDRATEATIHIVPAAPVGKEQG